MAKKQAFVDTPGYVGVLTASGLWTAASSGSPVYIRLMAAATGAYAVWLLVGHLVKRRRERLSDAAVTDA
ncbi:hypothetical protein RI138_17970 [Streptomyces sp. C11-1]|uniref:Integral membrane protein n=1 Tax=Streptomyces durocortorensis TaxID=2811104 RepID=A0ABY9VY85_9ACTN|nr:hypothetical protein [Streptomyces durocortorensis]WNF28568.1 hypothetical protein RI138_17970 [Streptomyces durocortorensis]